MPHGSKQGIEERKQNCLKVWADNPLLSYEEIAKKAGVSDKTFYRYRQDAEFMKQYREICQQRFKELESKAVELLNEQLDCRNWNAIKFTLENLGYKPTEKVEQVNETTIKVSVEDDEQ